MVIVYAIARDVFQQDDRTRVLKDIRWININCIAASPVFGGSVTALYRRIHILDYWWFIIIIIEMVVIITRDIR